MAKGEETRLKETQSIRLKLWELEQAGKTLRDAVKELMPIYADEQGTRHNTRRFAKLETWKARGWYPPPEVSTEAEVDGPTAPNTSAAAQREPYAEYVTREELQKTTAEIAAQLAELGERVSHLMNLSEQIGQSGQLRTERACAGEYPEAPPAPPLQGKKHVTERVKISVTVDPILFEKMKSEAGKRGFSMSRMVDTAVWHYFVRPALSFESTEE